MEAVEAVRAQWTQEQQRAIYPQEVDGLLKRIIDEAVTLAILEPATKRPECRQRFEMQQKLLNGHQCVCTPEADAQPLPLPMDVKHRYFRFTDKPIPYEFDYRKIMGETGGLCPIKGAIKRVFRGQDTDDSSSTNIREMIERFMERSWDEEKELWNRKMAENKKPTMDSDTETKDPLNISTVDIKDLKSLKELLKRALHELAESPKYILDTFPEAHKLSILVAWIRDRYGLRISPEERETARLESQYFWNYLIPRATAVRWPTRMDTELSAKVNWDYKEKLETMVCSAQ
ncbi:uncharacterized protein LOC128276477 [Anopheles cruzii]|uniref:uncharacterized protein LOC128276477 n=1 Tax=Anopheles cruzii TaxID=68878 RepID=UPI0022EC4D43|nr:uncharacterized protein LOC128276477 [Anopheles cruzii]